MKSTARSLLFAFLAMATLAQRQISAAQEQTIPLVRGSSTSSLILGTPEGWETWSPRAAVAPPVVGVLEELDEVDEPKMDDLDHRVAA